MPRYCDDLDDTDRLLLLWACVSTLACGRGSEEAKPAAAAPDAAQADALTEADPNTVRIEAGMLRDLRVTTANVESRPGGEQIALLGELAVDQGAYAEVGVPVAARVTRLLANAGDTVSTRPGTGGTHEPGTGEGPRGLSLSRSAREAR